MAPRDVVRLTAVNKKFQVDFAEPAKVAKEAVVASAAALTLEARDASLETIGRLLRSPDGIPQLPPFFQAEPREAVTLRLGSLAKEVSDLPRADQSARFSALLDLTEELGAERGNALTCLAITLEATMWNLHRDAVYDAFRGVANGLKRLPEDHPARIFATWPLSRSIPVFHDEINGEDVRRLVELLQPLSGEMREGVLNLPDEVLSPIIKNALRQAIAEEGTTSPSRAGTSARA